MEKSILIKNLLLKILTIIFKNTPISSKLKGSLGEGYVARKLFYLPSIEYEVINDLFIKKNNRSSQIDHVVVSQYGIFVIETKNYRGWIFGNEQSEYWTQFIYQKKSKFRNPIKQNQSHVYALKSLLYDYKKMIYYPIVVFTGNVQLKEISSQLPVIYGEELLSTIKKQRQEKILSFQQVRRIASRLREQNIHDRKTKKEHVQNIKNKYQQEQTLEKSLICPHCETALILREGSYGEFYGCPNYPRCKYTSS